MGFSAVFPVAVALSCDAFAASVCKGLGARRLRASYALTIAAFFGLFQAAMPILGYFLGESLRSVIMPASRPIAFLLLSAVGIKMIADALGGGSAVTLTDTLDYRELLLLSVATSIDAFAVGVTFSLLAVKAAPASLLIGAVTFSMSLGGVLLGSRLGSRFDSRFGAVGGAILLILAAKSLF